MSKIIDCYADGGFIPSYRNRYTRWKFGKPKHNYYVKNRRSQIKVLDLWDQYILSNAKSGCTIAFDCAGYYLDGVIDDLVVVDLDPIILSWFPRGRIYSGEQSVQDLYHTADNFIINNTIKLRWKTFDQYTEFWQDAIRFMRPDCEIFFSFRDIFIFHNRLKYNFSDLLRDWLQTMTKHGFNCKKYTYDIVPVTPCLTALQDIPEIDDMVNGNIKIHWQYQCK